MTVYPNPQFVRKSFSSLNGNWKFQIVDDFSQNTIKGELTDTICVPYCPESTLSGIGHTDIFHRCAYAKTISVSKEQLLGKVFIHFGACDYQSKLYVNERFVGEHIGGYCAFSFDITGFLNDGENLVSLLVYDDVTADTVSGKQCFVPQSFGCFYTRTTGIWQSVWLEFTPNHYISNFKFYPNINDSTVQIAVETVGGSNNLSAEIFFEGTKVGNASCTCNGNAVLTCKLSQTHLWELGKGNLYDVTLTFGQDSVNSYFGLRECKFSGMKFLLNGKSVFQRLVLDQGFNKAGIYTATTTEEMQKDIDIALDLGFNGARLHQKIFQPQFLYCCDKSGYMVWEELPSWGLDYSKLDSLPQALREWEEIIHRDFNHPSIITWCPANEFWTMEGMGKDGQRQCDIRYVQALYELTHKLDDTRPCVDASGGYHCSQTDVYDFHIYTGVTETKEYIKYLNENKKLNISNLVPPEQPNLPTGYCGQPIIASEYGGASFGIDANAWCYGAQIVDSDAWIDQIVELTKLHMECELLSGLCYTQLYDIEQEQNGLYYYNRTPKFNGKQREKLRTVLLQKAKIEK